MNPKYTYKIEEKSNVFIYVTNIHKNEAIFFGTIFRKRKKYWIFGPIIEEKVYSDFEIGEEKKAKEKLDDKLDKIVAGLNSKYYPVFIYEVSSKDKNQHELYTGYIRTIYYKYSFLLREVTCKGLECETFIKKTKAEIELLKGLMINKIVNSNISKFYDAW